MAVDLKLIEKLIFKGFANNVRFTQDSPIYPDVWLEYFDNAARINEYRADLILSPHRSSSAGELFKTLSERLGRNVAAPNTNPWEMASSGEFVVAKLTLYELVVIALPMTHWWQTSIWEKDGSPNKEHLWLRVLLGAILFAADNPQTDLFNRPSDEDILILDNHFKQHFSNLQPPGDKIINPVPLNLAPGSLENESPILWGVNRNRPAGVSLEKSVPATKADSCRKLFDIDGSGITWAVFDTGIDARHRAFLKKDPKTKAFYAQNLGIPADKNSNHTRILASYDFTKFRTILAGIFNSLQEVERHPMLLKTTGDQYDKKLSQPDVSEYVLEIERDLSRGRMLDWTIISPLLRIPHNIEEYSHPLHPHGTHVGGIIGAGEYDTEGRAKLIGMCPSISLYEIRVLDGLGKGDEFNILAALQFVRWLNNQKEGQIIHGVNLSFSMVHAVASYACGATPVCEACERLVAEGTIVVAAAGNLGQALYQNTDGMSAQGFRMVNITDPGNAEGVITVGSTHRDKPHSYGVSYFSSRGPTGDGRIKPDLVAPGEKIISSVLNGGTDRMDGTSMAAPHVSGAAALLLAKHHELIGRPRRIKEILCKTATNLGREKYFQGCGMLDVLRAIQSV